MNLLPKLLPTKPAYGQPVSGRSLLRREAELGGKLFGPVPAGRQRQFFCLDAHTWIWHETWQDEQGRQRSVTTRYDVRPNGVLKVQDGQHYQRLGGNEARNLYRAAQLYRQRLATEYQNLLQAA